MTSIAAKRKLLVSDLMTTTPRTLPSGASCLEAARIMRDESIGDVLVVDGDSLTGILTDRDIVVRVLAPGMDAAVMTVAEACTRSPKFVKPEDHALDALDTMRKHAVHRLPVLDNGRIAGIVSIGDLVLKLEDRTALAAVFEGQHAAD